MCDPTFFRRSGLGMAVLLLLLFAGALSAEIVVEGVENEEVYADDVTFQVPAEAGFDITATLNGEAVPVDADVRVDQAEYYELFVTKRDTETQDEETLLIMFIVRDSSRGNSEWGLAPWVPYPEIPSAAAEFEGARLDIMMPRNFPAGLPIPVVAWVRGDEDRRVGVNGRVSAAEFPDHPLALTRGVGFTFLPAQAAGAEASCSFSVQGLAAPRQVDIDAETAWTAVSGSLTTDTDWPDNARIHVTDDLEVAAGVDLTIGAGCVVKLAPGVAITVDGRIEANGTVDRPVVFVPEDRATPWGGMVLHDEASEAVMTAAIFTGSGADPDWFDNNDDSGSSHRDEECLVHLIDGARADFTGCAIIDNAGQAGHGEDAFLTLTDCLVAECITGGQFNGGVVNITGSALIGFPYVDAPFEDEDNDALYLTDGDHVITDTLIGWALDDGIDAGSGSAGSVLVTGVWFESCYHDAQAWSRDRDADAIGTVTINSGQGIECGHGDNLDVLAVGCLSTGNLVGARFGDNYDWTYDGYFEVRDSLLIYNKRDIFGRNWADWTIRHDQMDLHDNHLSAPNENHPNNVIWDPPANAELLAPFLTAPDDTVGVGIAVRETLVEAGQLRQGVPVRLSTFSRQTVSVDYAVRADGEAIDTGTLTFPPGQTVQMVPTQGLDLESLGVVEAAIHDPVNADVTGLAAVTLFQDVELVAVDAEWRYNDDGVAPDPDWMRPGFDDGDWPAGPAELGFGDGDEATEIDGGPSDDRHPAIYFRRSFTVDRPAAFDRLTINLRRDDGGVVYINGREVFRSNMPEGDITHDTWASGTTDSESAFYTREVDAAGLLVPDNNVIAVEVHQADAGSSDVSFALTLVGRPAFSVPGGFVRGEANGDGVVDLSDAVTVLLYLFADLSVSCVDALDANDSGALDLADTVYLLTYLFADGPAPPAPFPGSGEDPTADDLDCGGL